MGSVVCQGCGRGTNTALCNAYSEKPIGVATECYAAWVNDEWVPGCAYGKKGREMDTFFANTIIPKEKQTAKIRKVPPEEAKKK